MQAVEQFTSIHMGSSLYADARTPRGGDGAASWPIAGRMRLRGALSRAGTTWRQENG
jgi:hypothetical protein